MDGIGYITMTIVKTFGINLFCLIICFHVFGQDIDTATPSPTPTRMQIEFENLLVDNGNCNLPCWWGFHVGKSSLSAWNQFLDDQLFNVFREEPIDGTPTPVDYAYFSFPNSPVTAVIIQHETSKEDILEQLSIQLNRPDAWLSSDVQLLSLPSILDEPYFDFDVFLFKRGNVEAQEILIVDDDSGFMARYTYNLLDVQTNLDIWTQRLLCIRPEQTKKMEIRIRNPESNKSVSSTIYSDIMSEDSPYFPIEDWGISSEVFISFFVKNPNDCITIQELQEMTDEFIK